MNKLLLTLGSIAATATPILSTVSCGVSDLVLNISVSTSINEETNLLTISTKLNNYSRGKTLDYELQEAIEDSNKKIYNILTDGKIVHENEDGTPRITSILYHNWERGGFDWASFDNLTGGKGLTEWVRVMEKYYYDLSLDTGTVIVNNYEDWLVDQLFDVFW